MTDTSAVLGHDLFGSGAQRVVVLNDWMCDTSTWDDARRYLDGERFTYAFTDLRGYGRSMALPGAFTLAEAASDVLALTGALGWKRFSIIGHSMSTLITLHLAQQHPERVERAVVLTPPPPRGFGGDPAMIEGARALALGDDAMRSAALAPRFGDRLSAGWARYKKARWRATASPEAAAAYVALFARDGLPDPSTVITTPVLALTGEQDAEPMRCAAVTAALSPLCEHLEVVSLPLCGHYPMQEMPPLVVAHVERFLG